eukprot:TRINITY_DN11891_c0_g1_i1.p2 TRINITY_DN11891_c0_g1~~TRINITY_DN11891_c0_g1_i1.p2  ORF type:complete len:158 (-),score=45.37 TRINITY_DN11891_c0_g1_i1:60-533(-)
MCIRDRWSREASPSPSVTVTVTVTLRLGATHFLLELAARDKPNQVLVSGAHRSLVVDGAPFMPYGYFISGEAITGGNVSWGREQMGTAVRQMRMLAAQGVNHMMNYGLCYNPSLSLIHISEPTRLLSISYAVFCLKKKKTDNNFLQTKCLHNSYKQN